MTVFPVVLMILVPVDLGASDDFISSPPGLEGLAVGFG